MSKVLGIGGVFFKTADIAALKDWYLRVLGVEISDWGCFFTPDMLAAKPGAGTVFGPHKAGTDYFEPSDKDYMFNLVVDDMDGMLARCEREGVKPIKTLDESYGRFVHIMDLEGRKIELWEPKSSE
jgi:predicted enzyme related to lactoylglutathione lyase